MNNSYPYYNNPMFMQDLQNMRDRIDRQMMQLQQPTQQNQSIPQIQQTFQLSNPQSNNLDFDGKYTQGIDEVKGTLTLKNTLFVNKEMNTLWFKDVAGNIKTYTLSEVIELDEKDKEILALKKEIENLKGVVLNAQSNVKYNDEYATKQKSTDVPSNKSSNAK